MSTPYGRKALRGEEDKIRAAKPGERNNIAYEAAFRCGQLIPTGHLDSDAIEEALVDACVAGGLTNEEADQTIRSGIARGEDYPRGPAAPITSRAEALTLVGPYRATVIAQPWPGKSGQSDLIVMLTFVELASSSGGLRDIPAGLRRLAAMSGLRVTRVRSARDRLIELGYLRLAKRARYGNPPPLRPPSPHRRPSRPW